MKTLYGIQYLRAFAALAVVVFHAAEKIDAHFAIGAAGVDVFFVISGFIMWVISERRPVTPQGFIVERIIRIAPSYWIVTAVMIAGAFAGLFPNMKLTVEHILGSLFFIPVRSPSNGEIWPVLVQGWTLNFEIFFYALFAIALFLPRKVRLGALIALFGAFFVLGLLIDPQNPMLATYTRPIILEFLAGIFVAEFWLRGRIASTGIAAGLVIASLAGFAAIYFTGSGFDERSCGPLAVALVYGMVSLEANGRIGRVGVLAYLGDASYSIYLWHTLAISVIAKVGAIAGLPNVLLLPAAVVGGTILGIAAYECLEKPLRRILSDNGRRRLAPGRA